MSILSPYYWTTKLGNDVMQLDLSMNTRQANLKPAHCTSPGGVLFRFSNGQTAHNKQGISTVSAYIDFCDWGKSDTHFESSQPLNNKLYQHETNTFTSPAIRAETKLFD
jgi:hypothetical protein